MKVSTALSIITAVIATIVTEYVVVADYSVVDLSKPFDRIEDTSTTWAGTLEAVHPYIRSFVAIERGTMVEDYNRAFGVYDQYQLCLATENLPYCPLPDNPEMTQEDCCRVRNLDSGRAWSPIVYPNYPVEIHSATKGIVMTAIGMLIDQGLVSLDMQLSEIFTEESDWAGITDEEERNARQSFTLFEILTFSTGMSHDDVPDTLQDTLADGVYNPDIRGEPAYNAKWNILAYILNRVTGLTPKDFFEININDKLAVVGLKQHSWRESPDGIQWFFGGMHLNTHEMAKFGQLFLQKGYWKPGESLISEDWVQKVLTLHMMGVAPYTPLDGPKIVGYGFNNWMTTPFLFSKDTLMFLGYSDEDAGTLEEMLKGSFHTTGNGGFLIMVVPEKEVVVTIHMDSLPYSPSPEIQYGPVVSFLASRYISEPNTPGPSKPKKKVGKKGKKANRA